jgi:hypothetical protein
MKDQINNEDRVKRLSEAYDNDMYFRAAIDFAVIMVFAGAIMLVIYGLFT